MKNHTAPSSNHNVIHHKHREQLRGDSPNSDIDVEWSHFKAVPNSTPCSAPGRLTLKYDDQYA